MMKEQRRLFLMQSLQGLGFAMCSASMMSLMQSCEMNEDPVTPNGTTIPIDIDLAKPELLPLATVGGAVYYNEPSANNGNDFIIIRLEQDKFFAVTSICTHQGCQVNLPTTDKPTLFCPCHFAEFSANTGEVLIQPKQGTATKLPIYATQYDKANNRLIVYLPSND